MLVGKYGLKNKTEVLRVQYLLARIRKAARELLTLPETDPRRVFEGEALISKMVRIGVLSEENKKLDYVLGLTLDKFFDRRIQTLVFKSEIAKSIHEARTLIFQKKIIISKAGKRQVVDIPSFIVRKENDSHILKDQKEDNENSRTRKRTQRKRAEKEAAKGGDEE